MIVIRVMFSVLVFPALLVVAILDWITYEAAKRVLEGARP